MSPENAANMPNPRHLQAFCAVAESHSVSLAAQRVYLSQPAVSQAIANVESALQAPLFERHSRGMSLTPAGRLFHDRARRALEYLAAGTKEAARVGERRRGIRRRVAAQPLLSRAQLRALTALSASNNYTMAARSLGISQPSLHEAAHGLESLLEVRLFEKASRGIMLTRSGDILSQHVKLAFAEIEQGLVEVAELNGNQGGPVRIGTMPLARSSILPVAIRALAREQPGARISVIDGPYSALLRGLRYGEIDIIIGALRSEPPAEDVIQSALFDDYLAVIARSGHPLAKKNRISPRELMKYPWVIAHKGTPTRAQFDSMIETLGLRDPPGLIESSSQVLMRSLLMESDMLTLTSPQQIQYEQAMRSLTVLPVDLRDIDCAVTRSIGLTLRRDWRPTQTQLQFLRHVRTAAGSFCSHVNNG
jgi:LysR family transcriptional regulator, regulator for genes of the gallate degradation pathway